MKLFACERECRELLLRHDSSFHVGIRVEFSMDCESFFRRCVRDELNDDFPTHERHRSPVCRDVAEHPMFDLVPLARARRVVRDGDRETCLIREFLQLQLEEPRATRIAATSVGGDVEVGGSLIRFPTDALPPPTNGLCGKLRCVLVDADTDEALVLRDVVDAVGDGLTEFLVDEVMALHVFGCAFGGPLLASILVVPDKFFLLRVDADDRVPAFLECRCCLVDVEELRVTVGVGGTFLCLPIPLQAVLLRLEFFRHRHVAHLMALRTEFPGQFSRALAGPTQPAHGISAYRGFHECVEIGKKREVL